MNAFLKYFSFKCFPDDLQVVSLEEDFDQLQLSSLADSIEVLKCEEEPPPANKQRGKDLKRSDSKRKLKKQGMR